MCAFLIFNEYINPSSRDYVLYITCSTRVLFKYIIYHVAREEAVPRCGRATILDPAFLKLMVMVMVILVSDLRFIYSYLSNILRDSYDKLIIEYRLDIFMSVLPTSEFIRAAGLLLTLR
jgi:hypothetical protein